MLESSLVRQSSSVSFRSSLVKQKHKKEEMKMIHKNAHRLAMLVASAGLAIATAAHADQSPVCPADLDCTGQVGVPDLLQLLAEWGNPGSDADLTNDGTVGVPDLLELLANWGECIFAYPTPPANTEAWQIALEMLGTTGGLVPTQAIVDRVETDLALIRKAEPSLASQQHTMAWAPNQIIASYPADGENPNVDCLLAAYGGQVVNIFFGSMHVIQFPGHVNMAAMAQLFANLPETAWAEPDGLVGGQNFYVPTNLGGGEWHWWIDDGWHDCFDGCDCHIYYEFKTDAEGNVTLLNKTQQGQSWCTWPE